MQIIERLLRRQNMAVEQVAQHRLKYIKIANRVMEKQAALQAVDKLGDNLRLVDYEQLSIENRGYEDKVEEREEELAKLRRKSDCIYQVLAHFREKSAAATLDIMAEQNVLHSVEIEFMEVMLKRSLFLPKFHKQYCPKTTFTELYCNYILEVILNSINF